MLTEWDHTELKALIDGLDHTAGQMERKWGIGRLRLLVGDDLRARFDRQMDHVDKVLWGDDPVFGEIKAQIAAMGRAWVALDQAATGAGHQPRTADALECVLPDGTVCLIIDPRSGASPKPDGRQIAVYTTDEIGRLIESMKATLVVKQAFPGATVEAVRVKAAKFTPDRSIPF